MIGFLRFFGLLNAAVWLGAAVSFTIAIGPAFFSGEMKGLLPPPYNGAAAQIVMKRYFLLLHGCGVLALLHLFLEKMYLGKAVGRSTLALLSAIIFIGLLGGFWMQPKLKELHLKKYDSRAAATVRAEAARSFGVWHGISQSMNLVAMGGLLIYLWRVSNPGNGSRFVSAQKFRS